MFLTFVMSVRLSTPAATGLTFEIMNTEIKKAVLKDLLSYCMDVLIQYQKSDKSGKIPFSIDFREKFFPEEVNIRLINEGGRTITKEEIIGAVLNADEIIDRDIQSWSDGNVITALLEFGSKFKNIIIASGLRTKYAAYQDIPGVGSFPYFKIYEESDRPIFQAE